MPQIDKYVQHLLRFEALSLKVTSNGPVVATLASGAERASTQTVEHALLVAAVDEVAPLSAMADIRVSRQTRFQYPADDPRVSVEVTPTPGAWRLVLTPLERRAAPRTDVPVPPRATASMQNIKAVLQVTAPPAAALPREVPRAEAQRSASPERSIPVERSIPAPVRSAAPAQSPPQTQAPAQESSRYTPDGMRGASVRPEAPREPASSMRPAATPVERASPDPRPSPLTPAGGVDDDTSGIDGLLRAMTRLGASDLHLATGRPPLMRLHGEIRPLPGDLPMLTAEQVRALVTPTMRTATRREFSARNDADYAYEIAGVARFRCNVLMERRGPGAVIRRIPAEVVSAEELGVPRAVLELCDLPKGLVLVTGPTGSGKSTTLAAMIDRVNATRRDHIITIEDPIEFVHRNKRCLVNQREVGVHTDGFKHALRAALREDPDVVLVGELRDLETTAIAIETAETGHLVFGTLHTRTAPSTVDRIIDQFPSERQPQIRAMLSESLKGVVAQTLCKKVGGGRVAAYEVLLVTPAVANLVREGKNHQLYGVMQTSRQLGMQAQHDALTELVRSGKVDVREAFNRSFSKTDLRTALQNAGIPLPANLWGREG